MMSKDKEINDAMQQLILKNAQHAMELGKFALQIKKYKDRIIRVSKNKKDGSVYIATTQQYAQQNRFKVGHTPNLRARIYAYKTGRLGRNDEMYPCDSFDSYNRKLLYEIIKNKLRSVWEHPKHEMYTLHYTPLHQIVKYICKKDGELSDFLNEVMENVHNYDEAEPVIPEPRPVTKKS